MFKNSILLAIALVAFFNMSVSTAADITWGKSEILKLDKITYNGKSYLGSLIASDSSPVHGVGGLELSKPGVLVRGLRFGLDEVVPLAGVTNSPLCQNWGFPITSMWLQPPAFPAKVAVFTAPLEVVIYDLATWLQKPENAGLRQSGVRLTDQRLTCAKTEAVLGNE